MCKNSKIISSTKNGELLLCNGCKRYGLTFNNIFLQFNKKELKKFKNHINNIDVDYWLDFYAQSTKIRKIPVSTKQYNIWIFFTEEEFEELKLILLLKKKTNDNLSVCDISYTLILN